MLIKKLFFDFLEQNKLKIIIYFIIIIILFPIEAIGLSKLYAKLYTAAGKKITEMPNLLTNITNQTVLGLITLIIIAWILLLVLYSAKSTIEINIMPTYLSFIRKLIHSHTIKYFSEKYKDLKLGQYNSRIFELSRNIRNIFYFLLNETIPFIISLIVICSYYVYIDPTIGMICIASLFVLALISYIPIKNTVEYSRQRQHKLYVIAEKMQDSLGNLMNIYLNNATNDEINKNIQIENNYLTAYNKELKSSRNMVAMMSISTLFIFSILIFMSYNKFKTGKNIDSTSFVTMLIISTYFINYLIKFIHKIPFQLNIVGVVLSSQKFLTDIFSQSQSSHPTTSTGKEIQGNITLKNLNFSYLEGKSPIFDNFNLTIKKGDKVAVFGESGSGKTTLMKILLRLYPVKRNMVYLDGVDINDYDIGLLREKINYVNQRTLLFNSTILDNIAYGNGSSEKEIKQMINKYDLGSVFINLDSGKDMGIHSSSGVNGNNLSHGMQKVTMLLRGILKKNTSVYIFDEPLSGLDQITREKVVKMINNETKGKTVIIITHDKEILKLTDQVVYLNPKNNFS